MRSCLLHFHVCCCSVTKSYPTSCDPMDCRLPCPSLTPRDHLNSCPLSWWCYLTTSSSAIPFSFCLQSFPSSGSFPMSQLFASSGQRTGASASASLLPVNIQDWFPLGLTSWISLQSRRLSRIFSSITIWKHQNSLVLSFMVQLSYPYMNIRKTIALTSQTFVSKVMSLLFNVLSRFVIAFLPRNKHL